MQMQLDMLAYPVMSSYKSRPNYYICINAYIHAVIKEVCVLAIVCTTLVSDFVCYRLATIGKLPATG